VVVEVLLIYDMYTSGCWSTIDIWHVY